MRNGILALTLLLAALLWGCGGAVEQGEVCQVYFGARTGAFGDPALLAEYRELREGEAPEETLIRYLLQGPEGENLVRVIPEGVALRGIRLERGVATVDFSARYGTLSGIELTLADYSVTMTLSQLPQVEAVVTTVEGNRITYRAHERLTGEDVRLSLYRGTQEKRQITLFFPRQDGAGLEGEERTLLLREEETLTVSALRALCQGPETPGLLGVLTEAELLSAKVRDGVCYLNLAASFWDLAPQNPAENRLVLAALTETLCQLDNITELRLLSEGESLGRYGAVNLTEPLRSALPRT